MMKDINKIQTIILNELKIKKKETRQQTLRLYPSIYIKKIPLDVFLSWLGIIDNANIRVYVSNS